MNMETIGLAAACLVPLGATLVSNQDEQKSASPQTNELRQEIQVLREELGQVEKARAVREAAVAQKRLVLDELKAKAQAVELERDERLTALNAEQRALEAQLVAQQRDMEHSIVDLDVARTKLANARAQLEAEFAQRIQEVERAKRAEERIAEIHEAGIASEHERDLHAVQRQKAERELAVLRETKQAQLNAQEAELEVLRANLDAQRVDMEAARYAQEVARVELERELAHLEEQHVDVNRALEDALATLEVELNGNVQQIVVENLFHGAHDLSDAAHDLKHLLVETFEQEDGDGQHFVFRTDGDDGALAWIKALKGQDGVAEFKTKVAEKHFWNDLHSGDEPEVEVDVRVLGVHDDGQNVFKWMSKDGAHKAGVTVDFEELSDQLAEVDVKALAGSGWAQLHGGDDGVMRYFYSDGDGPHRVVMLDQGGQAQGNVFVTGGDDEDVGGIARLGHAKLPTTKSFGGIKRLKTLSKTKGGQGGTVVFEAPRLELHLDDDMEEQVIDLPDGGKVIVRTRITDEVVEEEVEVVEGQRNTQTRYVRRVPEPVAVEGFRVFEAAPVPTPADGAVSVTTVTGVPLPSGVPAPADPFAPSPAQGAIAPAPTVDSEYAHLLREMQKELILLREEMAALRRALGDG